MAKINLTTQHNQENLSALASLGVLICMIVTLVGIKLWWFKHRLSFEQTSTPSSSSSTTPPVIVPRRSKQQKYKKDKRYSQQIYESVEVHGVFRQKREDDWEIHRPAHLPPVRIRQSSESTSSLILPPPRTKRRDQVHSTAFEDLEVITPPTPLATASSSDLSTIPEINTKISLTFEEFQRQFKLKEMKPEVPESTKTNNEVNEIPVPPLRLNRSTSSMAKPEKPQRFLKSSQSITIPEFHKVVDKRQATGLSSPKEDLTKIDIDEKAKIFEAFREPKASTGGYIKYEEVDSDLQERELNAEIDKQDFKFIDKGFCESPPPLITALKALRNERIIYNNDLNESPDAQFTEEYDFNRKSYKTNKWLEVDFQEEESKSETNAMSKIKYELSDSIFKENTEYNSVSERKLNKFKNDSTNFEKNFVTESKTIKQETFTNEQIPKELSRDSLADHEKLEVKETGMEKVVTTRFQAISDLQNSNASDRCQNSRFRVTEPLETSQIQNDTVSNNHHIVEDRITTKFYDIKEPQAYDEYDGNNQLVNKEKSQEVFQNSATTIVSNGSFNSLAESWPQFDEKIETPQVTVRRFNKRDLEAQNSFDENDGISLENEIYNEDKEVLSSTQTIPTGYARNWANSPELPDVEEWQQAFNNKFYNQVRSFMTAESSLNSKEYGLRFDSSVAEQCDKENNKNSLIHQRRPTGYIRQNESVVSPNDQADENIENEIYSNVEEDIVQSSKVTFEDSYIAAGSENETEKFTLNQRRPTGFVKIFNNENSEIMAERQIKFDEATVFKDLEELEDSIIKQRRPTGFIKELQTKSAPQEVSPGSPAVRFIETDKSFEDHNDNNESLVKQRRPTAYERPYDSPISPSVRFLENEKISEDYETKNESLIKQRRPTGYIRPEELTNSSSVCYVEAGKSSKEFQANTESWVEQRRPTGYKHPGDSSTNSLSVQFLETEKSSEDYKTNNESLLYQRRPTGYARSEIITDSPSLRFVGTEKSFRDYETNESLFKQSRPTGYARPDETLMFPSVRFLETEKSSEDYQAKNESLLSQRRPTGYVRPEVLPDPPSVRFAETEKYSEDSESTNESLVKQRRPTGYVRQEVSLDSSSVSFLVTEKTLDDNETNTESMVKQIRPTGYVSTVKFLETEKTFEDSENKTESLVKQRRPTGYIQQAQLHELEKQVSFQLDSKNNEDRSHYNEALQQRRPTGFIRKEEINKHVNFELNQNLEDDAKRENEKLRQRRPTGFARKKELKCLENLAPIYQPLNDDNNNQDFDNHLWQELEKDVELDLSSNFEEEFAKIRHSYELNEADFLELKDELQKSPTDDSKQPLGFGKSIEDDWENFEQLKNQVVIKPLQSPETEIKITFSDNDLANTISILKDTKLEEDIHAKPRKSKVTFDFKTEEHVIPARKSHNYSEEDTDNDEDGDIVYDRNPPPLPPQPIKRVSNINYNNELTSTINTPTSITFFGSQTSSQHKSDEDSWSAIRKHRILTSGWQNFSTQSSQTLPTPTINSPPKPTYRNPMAQLAIQRAKEVRADMDGFKSRSINDRKPEASKRQKQKLFYLNNDDNLGGTEA